MSSPVAWTVQSHWPPEARHVGDARRFVVDRLVTDEVDDDLAHTAGLIVTELATNAVRHADSEFRVTVVRESTQVLLEVHDESSWPALPRTVEPLASNGRGLQLVGALSSSWGVTPHAGGGKSVWAALDIAARALRP